MYKNKPLPDKTIRKEQKYFKKILMLLMENTKQLLKCQNFIDFLDSLKGPDTHILQEGIIYQNERLEDLCSLMKKFMTQSEMDDFKEGLILAIQENLDFYQVIFYAIQCWFIHHPTKEVQQWQKDDNKDDDETPIYLDHYH